MNKETKSSFRFSLVIPTRNRRVDLGRCLDVLVRQLEDGDEIVVTEDDPALDSQINLRDKYPSVKWLLGPCRGPAANRNNGAKEALNDFIVFLDDDCVPSENLLSKYREFLTTHPDVDAIEGAIKPIGIRKSMAAVCPSNSSGGYFWTCNVLFKRSVFFEVGGFDEGFPFPCMEDSDIYHRLKSLGARVPFLQSACVGHPWVVRKDVRLFQHSRLSLLYFLDRHPKELDAFGYLRIFRTIKKSLREFVVDGVFGGCSDRVFYLRSVFDQVVFLFVLVQRGKKGRYVRGVVPCCGGCESLVSRLSDNF